MSHKMKDGKIFGKWFYPMVIGYTLIIVLCIYGITQIDYMANLK